MEILIFQLIIFGIIFISSYSGRKTLDVTVVVISIFTIIAVFTSWLMILQFATIVISYLFTLDKMSLRKEKEISTKSVFVTKNNHKSENNSGCLTFTSLFTIIVGSLCAYNVWSVKNSNNKVSTPTLIEEKTNKTNVESNNYDVYEYDTNSYEEPTYYVDTLGPSDTNNFNEEKNQNNYDYEYGYDDDYRDYEENEHSDNNNVKYGNFTFFQDRNCEISNAQLRIRKNGFNQIKFFLQVNNEYHMGEISGIAIISEDFQSAVFKSKDCESLIFYFLQNGQIHIKENNCRNYHGTNICFDSVFY